MYKFKLECLESTHLRDTIIYNVKPQTIVKLGEPMIFHVESKTVPFYYTDDAREYDKVITTTPIQSIEIWGTLKVALKIVFTTKNSRYLLTGELINDNRKR